MEASSSSNVTVEYHDPSGVFSLISRDLFSRLPLRNLNWQSRARPLRQIKHLHVDFVPSAETQAALRLPSTQNDAPPNSIDILRSGFEPPKPAAAKERRHQIPGLKTTPYLKIYVLRCDDKNWYKQEERRKLKEWVHDIKDEDGRHEHHDAFEWLILHVVIPDTIAASEPRWRESSKDPDELKERSKGPGAKLLGKSQKTVLDRLRADFSDGKGTHDHIAQIRLSKNQIAIDLLPVPALGRTIEESAEEREKSWSDVMFKIRTSILSSFDTRVRQYEDDITEQESRRSLPGWNFCTFFIHKEGLARALESVGLVEDALAIYDELSFGLETVLGDMASDEAAQTATSFAPTGSDIIDRIVGNARTAVKVNDENKLMHSAERLFDKDYREEIVRSAISVFDFFCYLYERQSLLILRLAGRSATTGASGVKEGGDDLVMLAEVCWRGLSFLHNGARVLKRDLNLNSSFSDAQSLVLSWTYAAADLILTRTQSTHLDLSDSGIKSDKSANGHAPGVHRAEFGFSMGADAYPQRNSSLPFRKPAGPPDVRSVTTTSSAGKLSDDGFFSPPSSSDADGTRPAAVPGLAELAAYRAELVSLKRKSLDALAALKGWQTGWAVLASMKSLNDLGVNGLTPASAAGRAPNDEHASCPIGEEVAEILKSKDSYEAVFELLTESAARHYLLATHVKSAENLMGDLAVSQYFRHDFASAATYFQHSLPNFESDDWQVLQLKALVLYIDCLRHLDRYGDMVKGSIELLASVIERRMLDVRAHQTTSTDDLVLDVCYIEQLFTLSRNLPEPMVIPFGKFFANLELTHEIGHHHDRDGFCYSIRFENFMRDVIVENIALQLTHVDDTSTTITLTSPSPVTLKQGVMDVQLVSNTTVFGMFSINQLDFSAKNLIFRHELKPKPPPTGLALSETPEQDTTNHERRPHLLVYPAPRALDTTVSLSATTVVHKARHITVKLDSGRNDIETVDVRLKPASAGLRLHLNDAQISDIDQLRSKASSAGLIALGSMPSASIATIRIRYSLEQPISDLHIKAEVNYTTTHGLFTVLQDVHLATQLPLDVDVKDTFHLDMLLSTFTVRTTNGQPVILNDVALHDSLAFAVESPPEATTPAIVLAQYPTDFVYKISRKPLTTQVTKQDSALKIVLNCIPLQELITATVAARLSSALANSEFAPLRRLILPLIRTRCYAGYTSLDMDMAALTNETKVPSFADLGWFEIIDTLPVATQRPLSDWLMRWHIDHQRIKLAVNDLDSTLQKHITILVDVPSMEQVFLTSLALEPLSKEAHPQTNNLTVGETAQMVVRVRHTRQWSANESQSLMKSSKGPDFVYELLADPNVWMISGRRRACFTAADRDGVVSATIIAVPLKPGIWPLPTIVVRPLSTEGIDEDNAATPAVTCEISCASAGQVVHITKDQQFSRVVVVEHEKVLPVPTIPGLPGS